MNKLPQNDADHSQIFAKKKDRQEGGQRRELKNKSF